MIIWTKIIFYKVYSLSKTDMSKADSSIKHRVILEKCGTCNIYFYRGDFNTKIRFLRTLSMFFLSYLQHWQRMEKCLHLVKTSTDSLGLHITMIHAYLRRLISSREHESRRFQLVWSTQVLSQVMNEWRMKVQYYIEPHIEGLLLQLKELFLNSFISSIRYLLWITC